MVKGWFDIQNVIVSNLESLTELAESLQKEFEYIVSYTSDPKVLQAKKNQISSLNLIINDQEKTLKAAINSFELQEKTELCLMHFGVSYSEYKEFLKHDLLILIEAMNLNRAEKRVQIPIIFEHYLDYADLKPKVKEIKYSDKPVMGLQGLAEMSEKGIKILNTFSVKEALKEIDVIIDNHKKSKANENR